MRPCAVRPQDTCLPFTQAGVHRGTMSTPRFAACSCACQATLPCPAGYPFDVPEVGAGVFTCAALAYHLPLMIAFSVKQRINFVWGGCMLFSRTDMTGDTYGIMQVCGLHHKTNESQCDAACDSFLTVYALW